MAITPIITIQEADAYLAAYPDWLALTNEEKDSHIYNASLYVQTNWTCVDVDWEDTANIPEEIKHATALYALADSQGNLYGDAAAADSRNTTREMIKAGAVTLDTYYTTTGKAQVGIESSFGLPDELMGLHCTATSGSGSGGVTLTRV